jgi:hypothetical protein
VLLHQLTKYALEFLATSQDVATHFSTDILQHGAANVERAWIGCHGVSIQSNDVLVGNVLLQSKYREWILASIDCLGD